MKYKNYLLLPLLFCSHFCFGQEQDLSLRSEVGVQYRFNKKSNLNFSYRLDLIENVSQFQRANISLAYEHNLTKWLQAELYYRLITNHKQDEHRFRIALSAQEKVFRKTQLQLRTLLQHDVDYFDAEYLRTYKPELIWRNRIMLKRDLPKKFSATIYTEPFFSESYKGFNLYRLRTGATIAYEKKRWKYTAEYFYQTEFYFKQETQHTIGVGARYDVTRVLRPKKKNRKRENSKNEIGE